MISLRYSFLSFFLFLAAPAFSQPAEDDRPVWSWIKNKAEEIKGITTEKSHSVLDKTKTNASITMSYLSARYEVAKDGTAIWTKEKYDQFSSDYPDIAANMHSFSSYTSQKGKFALEKTKDGATVAYQVSSDGIKTAASWSKEKIEELPQITACGISEYDLLGGVAIGTLATALTAGTSTAATTTTVVYLTPTIFGWMTAATATATSVVSTPVVAVGVTATAVAGATLYATAKGVCWHQNSQSTKHVTATPLINDTQ